MHDAPGISWRWSAAWLGALFVLPAAIVTLRDPSLGLALAFGAVPAAAVGITPARRSRHVIVLVGGCIGVSLVLGAVLARSWVLAVPGIFGLSLGAAGSPIGGRSDGCSCCLPCPCSVLQER